MTLPHAGQWRIDAFDDARKDDVPPDTRSFSLTVDDAGDRRSRLAAIFSAAQGVRIGGWTTFEMFSSDFIAGLRLRRDS